MLSAYFQSLRPADISSLTQVLEVTLPGTPQSSLQANVAQSQDPSSTNPPAKK